MTDNTKDDGMTSFDPTKVFLSDQMAIVFNGDADKGSMAFMFRVGDQRPAFLLDIGPISAARRQNIEAVAARLLQLIGQIPEQ